MTIYSCPEIQPLVIHTAARSCLPTLAIPHILRFLSTQEQSLAAQVGSSWQKGVELLRTPSCASKHDTLLGAQLALPKELASVPPFFGLTDDQIRGLFSQETQALWQQIISLKEKVFSLEYNDLLPRLQESMRKDILGANLPLSPRQERALSKMAGKHLMVRSSSDEDTVDGINAGGNESVRWVPATVEGIKLALTKVIPSYFSEKSLKNRSAFTDPFQKMPACSALIMEQIEGTIISGVMMTHKTAWFREREGKIPHITASHGFGGGIVSGTTSSDEWILTENEWVSTIRFKSHQTTSMTSEQTEEVPNSLDLQIMPSLTKTDLQKLQITSCCLEEYFRKPMDVEFVFQGDKLYVVQTRGIQAPEIQNPTFLDLPTTPSNATLLQGTTLVSGMSQSFFLLSPHILFAKDLDEADRNYVPGKHKAALIYTLPNSNNTHAEVNFSSQRPPLPCFWLPIDAWYTCQKQNLHFCSQRGLVVITEQQLPIQKGLIQHPAHLLVSVDGTMPVYQSAISSHCSIQRFRTFLSRIEEQIAAEKNQPLIAESLQALAREITTFFTDISQRTAAQTANLQSVIQAVHIASLQTFRAMQQAAEKKKYTLLSFHTGVFRQLLQQTGQQVVGAHSMMGLEKATLLPAPIESFLIHHRTAPVLCALALLAKKAWDEPLQQNWLSFLEKNKGEVEGKVGQALFAHLQELDALGQMSLWFATYFANETPPPLATLLEQEPETQAFTRHCFDFTRQWQSLLARGEKINTSSELIASWDTLQKLTAAYLDFCAKFPKRTLMQTLQLSNVTYDLIQLWDAQIKQVKTSRLLSVEETNQLYTARIEQFREFGLKALACRAIAFDKADANDFRAFFLGETTGRGYFHSHNGKDGGFHNGGEFSVQHWIVPLSEGRRPPPNDDARLTIVHQNFLRACALRLEPHLLDLLPKKLKESLQIFQQRDTYQANRFQPGKATFISLREESATVTVNIPMNYHSMILTIQQNRESDAIVFNAYWKGTDHEEKFRLPLIQSFCAVSELLLQNYTVKGLDFQVTLLANNATQADLISRMIHSVNESRWSCSDNVFGQLVTAMHEPSTNRELTREEFYIELEQTALRMKDILWKQFVATGTLPDDLLYIIRHIFTRQYLQERGLLPMIIERVTQELEGQKPPSVWSQNFSKLVLNTMPIDTQKKLV